MSDDWAIRVEGLGKRYSIAADRGRYTSFRDVLSQGARRAASRLLGRGGGTPAREPFWALRDVSFEVPRGEVVGIIGRNGAGKSTLLKILSRITEPTEGEVELRGRVGSLLEVGTGFHPELTGRENVYLNGAILGMTRREIARNFDEIVAFAEVERFLDTPVKHYSSGMYTRLAFAVAAHLEPQILIVDEVLAVGDAEFQKKCLGKMGEVASEGRTVLFVSHNMGAVRQLCTSAMLLRVGRVELIGTSEEVVRAYLTEGESGATRVIFDGARKPNSAVVFTECRITNAEGKRLPAVDVTQPFEVALGVLAREDVKGIDLGVRFHNSLGQPLFTCSLLDAYRGQLELHPGEHTFAVRVPGHFLAPDTYSLTIGLHRPNVEVYDLHESAINVTIEETGSRMWMYSMSKYGNILTNFSWRRLTCDKSEVRCG